MPEFYFEGKRVHYLEAGQGDCLLLLPGNTSSSAIHGPDIEHFARAFRVLCPDYLGCGRSERVDDLAEDFWWANARMVIDLLRHRGIDRVVAVGTSGGGIIALAAAILAPNTVRGVAADSFKGETLSREWVREIARDRQVRSEGQRQFWSGAHGDDWERVVDFDTRMLEKAACTGASLFHGRLSEIRCPVLLTGSLADEFLPDLAEGMLAVARQLPSARTIFFSTGGHPVMWSRADDFRREVEDLLRRLEPVAP